MYKNLLKLKSTLSIIVLFPVIHQPHFSHATIKKNISFVSSNLEPVKKTKYEAKYTPKKIKITNLSYINNGLKSLDHDLLTTSSENVISSVQNNLLKLINNKDLSEESLTSMLSSEFSYINPYILLPILQKLPNYGKDKPKMVSNIINLMDNSTYDYFDNFILMLDEIPDNIRTIMTDMIEEFRVALYDDSLTDYPPILTASIYSNYLDINNVNGDFKSVLNNHKPKLPSSDKIISFDNIPEKVAIDGIFGLANKVAKYPNISNEQILEDTYDILSHLSPKAYEHTINNWNFSPSYKLEFENYFKNLDSSIKYTQKIFKLNELELGRVFFISNHYLNLFLDEYSQINFKIKKN